MSGDGSNAGNDNVLFSAFCVSSVGMQLLNKGIALELRSTTALDNLLMMWQNGCAAMLCAVLVLVAEHGPRAARPVLHMQRVRAPQIRRLFLPSVNFVLMLLCSIKALRTLHIATVVVARNVCTALVATGEYVLFGRAIEPRQLQAMGVCVLGSLLYAYNDLTYDATGYCWQGMNCVLFTVGQLYEKWCMSKTVDQTPLGVAMIKNLWSLPISLALVLMLGEHVDIPQAVASLSRVSVTLIALSGFGCFALSICYMTLYKTASATSITVAANFNKVVSIVAAQGFFGGSLGLLQFFGLAVCVAASAGYSLAVRPKAVQKTD